jgi:ABC-type sugar transport system ATPase subunit
VFAATDRISVLRDGRLVGTVKTSDASPDSIITMMIGRELQEYFPRHLEAAPGAEIFRVEELSSPGLFSGISFSIRKGEIVGIAGLVGSGRSEMARALFGLDPNARGRLVMEGKDISETRQRTRMRFGLALVPEDRKREGLALVLSCRFNFSSTLLRILRRLVFLDRHRENKLLEKYFGELAIKTPSYEQPVSALSGGNQQKIVLAKWLARNARVLILDEPTRGVDVGAKAAIHALIDDLARQGIGILLISSELPEVMNLSTRILVMREGRMVSEVPRARATQEELLRLMSGILS